MSEYNSCKGAPNPADIACNTTPNNNIMRNFWNIFCRLINEDTVAPNVQGPYIPTDAPPLIEINDANVDPKPPFKSKISSMMCA